MQKMTYTYIYIRIPKRNKPNKRKWILNPIPNTELLCFANKSNVCAISELFFQKEELKFNLAANEG